MGRERNQLCGCGSGKRFKYCHGRQDDWSTELLVGFAEAVAIDRWSVDGKSGEVSFEAEGRLLTPQVTYVTRSCPRSKGSKVVSQQLFGETCGVSLSPDANLLRFKAMIAVDTSTAPPSHDSLSLTVGMLVECQRRDEHLTARRVGMVAFECRDRVLHPERRGWRLVLEYAMESRSHQPLSAYAMLVDAHLGDHDDINERRQALDALRFLPPNWRLLYASADKPSASLANRLMAEVDKESRKLRDRIALAAEADMGPFPANLPLDQRFRLWTLSDMGWRTRVRSLQPCQTP